MKLGIGPVLPLAGHAAANDVGAVRCLSRMRWRLPCVVIVMSFAAGCGCRPEFADVEGNVTRNGKPLAGVEIVFMPDPEKGGKGPRASAYSDDTGHFKLRSEKADQNGAVVGLHRVCVVDIGAVTTPSNLPGMQPGGDGNAVAPKMKGIGSRVPLRYNNPASTPLSAEVKAGPQTLDFDVRATEPK